MKKQSHNCTLTASAIRKMNKNLQVGVIWKQKNLWELPTQKRLIFHKVLLPCWSLSFEICYLIWGGGTLSVYPVLWRQALAAMFFPQISIPGVNYKLDFMSIYYLLPLSASLSFALYHFCCYQILQSACSRDASYETGLSPPGLYYCTSLFFRLFQDLFVWSLRYPRYL